MKYLHHIYIIFTSWCNIYLIIRRHIKLKESVQSVVSWNNTNLEDWMIGRFI